MPGDPLRIAALALLLVLAGAPAPAATRPPLNSLPAPPAAATLADMVGVNDATTDPLLSSMAVSTVRNGVGAGWPIDFSWGLLQPARGAAFNFTATDAMVAAVQAAGRQVLPLLGYTAPWANPSGNPNKPPANISDWTTYVSAVVAHYSGAPFHIEHFQVWNEPTREAGFWQGANNTAWVDDIYLPAARVIRAAGGKVVFGGWPASNSLQELQSILDHRQAWAWTDVLDVHYRDLPGMLSLYQDYIAPGRIAGGLWQTELGWNRFTGLLPSFYARFFYWQLATTRPAAPQASFRLFWYAWWQPSDNRTLVNQCSSNATCPTFHGRQLQHLARLFGPGEASSSPPVGFAAYANITVAPPLPFAADTGESAVFALADTNNHNITVVLALADGDPRVPHAGTVEIRSPSLAESASVVGTDSFGNSVPVAQCGGGGEGPGGEGGCMAVRVADCGDVLSLRAGGIRITYLSWATSSPTLSHVQRSPSYISLS